MKKKSWIFSLFLFSFFAASCNSQSPGNQGRQSTTSGSQKLVGGGCDGCELMFVGLPDRINPVDTSAGWWEAGRKLAVTGTVFQADGKTVAPGVLIYYWQTDNSGYYSPVAGMDDRARRHGHIRGWVQTGSDGTYTIYTIRPGAYPDGTEAEHIHLSIKEPDIDNEYYIDDILFEDDPILPESIRKRPLKNRGGNGVVRTVPDGNLLRARRDIILGRNIENYPSVH